MSVSRPLAGRNCWLFCDLDGTLVPLPHRSSHRSTTTTSSPSTGRSTVTQPVSTPNVYVPIDASPTFEPLRQWLLLGGNLAVITTADRRAIEQVADPFLSTLRDIDRLRAAESASNGIAVLDIQKKDENLGCASSQLVLSLWGGSALFRCRSDGSVLPDPAYLRSAIQGGTTLSTDVVARIVAIAYDGYQRAFDLFVCQAEDKCGRFGLAQPDGSLTPLACRVLSPMYQDLWQQIVQDVDAMIRARPTHLPATSRRAIFRANVRSILENANALRIELCTSSSPGEKKADGRMAEDDFSRTNNVAQVLLLGIPMKVFSSLVPKQDVEAMYAMGAYAQSQPNSVIICRRGAHKGRSVHYIVDHCRRQSTSESTTGGIFVSMGDLPDRVDRKLIGIPGCPFVSVEDLAVTARSRRPPRHGVVVVGGEEVGAAAFLHGWTHEVLSLVKQVPAATEINVEVALHRAVERAAQDVAGGCRTPSKL